MPLPPQIPHLRKVDGDLYARVLQNMHDHGVPVEEPHPSLAASFGGRGRLPGVGGAAAAGLPSLPPGLPAPVGQVRVIGRVQEQSCMGAWYASKWRVAW